MFRHSDDIPPRGGQPTFIPIILSKASSLGDSQSTPGLGPCNVHKATALGNALATGVYGFIQARDTCAGTNQLSRNNFLSADSVA